MTLVLPIILVLGAVTMFQRESGRLRTRASRTRGKVLDKSAKAPRRKTREAPKR